MYTLLSRELLPRIIVVPLPCCSVFRDACRGAGYSIQIPGIVFYFCHFTEIYHRVWRYRAKEITILRLHGVRHHGQGTWIQARGNIAVPSIRMDKVVDGLKRLLRSGVISTIYYILLSALSGNSLLLGSRRYNQRYYGCSRMEIYLSGAVCGGNTNQRITHLLCQLGSIRIFTRFKS